MAGWLIVIISAGYLAVLFGVAYWGDRRADAGRSVIANGTVYALSLAVYATSWTFYGSVGRAVGTGAGFLPIYLGPTIMAAFWWFLLRSMIRSSKRHRITSIADLVAHRYGNSAVLGGLVTIVAVVGIVPYIALQLKAVSDTFSVLRGGAVTVATRPEVTPVLQDTALYVALFLAAFTILFGTRHLDASERHEGMVAAIAMESVVKLVAFTAVGLYVTFGLFGGLGDLFSRAAASPAAAELFTLAPQTSYQSWFWLTVLSMFAILFLPRQFQVSVVENVDERHLNTAIWLFPLYLLAINLFVLPIAVAGLLTFPDGAVNPDTFVLALPMVGDQPVIALTVFVGGLSAATGMVIVETIALATMVSNSLVIPTLLWLERRGVRPAVHFGQREDLSGLILQIRRTTIVAVLLLGYGYFRVAGEGPALVAIGLVSFAAVAQFAPAIIGGLFWRGGTRNGALTGLLAGFAIWIYTMLLPTFTRSGWLPESLITQGPWGAQWLRPEHLFGLTGMDAISHGMFWSMLANTGGYVAVSVIGGRSTAQRGAAQPVQPDRSSLTDLDGADAGRVSIAELQVLLQRFLGLDAAKEVLEDYIQARADSSSPLATSRVADGELVRHVEILLSGAVGTTSARVMVAAVVNDNEPLWVDEVMDILDEASQVLAYSRELERKSVELEQATAELREANERLRELDQLKDEFVSSVSHELRTPLTSIRALSEILVDNLDLPAAEREKYLRIVVEETERLTRLINQVLDMSKLASGAVQWQITEVDLAAVVQDSATACAQLFQQRGAELTVSVPPYVPSVSADRDRMVQVVINLLSNAAKFCAESHGRVSVTLHVERDDLQVDVTDDGEGIPPEDQARIFERFQQGPSAHSGGHHGTGLGLPISQEIVRHFGGRLWVRSVPGHGATFSFTVPMGPVLAGHEVEA